MAAWLAQNYGSIIVFTVLSAIVALIVIFMIRNKKKGKSACSCGGACGGCPMAGKCHGAQLK